MSAQDRNAISRGVHFPYRSSISATSGSAILAGLVVGTGDILVTLTRPDSPGGGAGFIVMALALYVGVATLFGLLQGVVFGAARMTFPQASPRALWRRLDEDEALDRTVAAAILGGSVALLLYLGIVAMLAMRLVGVPTRKLPGALLLGAGAIVLIPILALLALPLIRVTRRIPIPRLGIPRSAVVFITLVLAGLVGATVVVSTQLDVRALPVGGPLTILFFVAVQVTTLAFFGRRLQRVPLLAIAAALLAPIGIVAFVQPSPRTVALLAEGRGTSGLASIVRAIADLDRDGFSALLGGGDCNDRRRDVYPGAEDRPGNGIDENCLGGDAAVPDLKPTTALSPARDHDAKPPFKWDGNILVILVDTLRADRLGVAGYMRKGKSLTPNLDALASRGVRFTNVYAQAPNTPRSYPSIMTSRYPSSVKWEDSYVGYPKMLPENLSIVEVLHDAGFHTAGISSHFYFKPERGVLEGFAEYDNGEATSLYDSNFDSASPRISARVTAKVRELAAGDKRFFLFTHLFEPHSDYMPHKEFPIEGTGIPGLVERYDYEIAYTDKYVGEILAGLEAAGVADKTLVVILSDHGEGFGDHRMAGERKFFHGHTLYDEVLRVPLIMAVPGLTPRVVDEQVQLIDVAPTLADLVHISAPTSFQGRSLLPALVGDKLEAGAAHAELLPVPSWKHHHKAMVSADGKTKLIYRVSDNLFELYDLAADPTERTDISATKADLLSEMRRQLTTWIESAR
jgi:arylsulfatase A-like enzyme